MITHSGRLERWLGLDNVEKLSKSMHGWYGPPIAVAGVPGNVWVGGDGDFGGELRAGWEMSALDRARDICWRWKRATRIATGPEARSQLNAGFASLSAMISAATTVAGARLDFYYQKTEQVTSVTSASTSCWRLPSSPAAGSAPAAAAAGTAYTSSSTGAMPFTNPTGGTQQFFVAGFPMCSTTGQSLLIDLLFGVNKTMASTATEAVTGVPTRYTNTVATAADYSGGNFIFPQVGGTVLAATGHNWTVCKYTNQAGTTGQSAPSVAGISAAQVDRIDLPLNTWYMPLASGDSGLTALTQIQVDASIATGVLWVMVAHPLVWMPCPVSSLVCPVDGINTSFNLVRIFDNACMTLLYINRGVAAAQSIMGSFTTLSG